MKQKTTCFEEVKSRQRRQWDAAALGWRKWWQTFEDGAQSLSDRLVEMAKIEPGQRVLDVATGIGEPAVTAAHKVGPLGGVVAIDQAPQMLAIAEERVRELGLTNVEFRQMDAEGLELPESSFDAVLCRWGLMFLPNYKTSLCQIWRLLVPGGCLAAAVWDIADRVPVLSLPMRVAGPILNTPSPPPGTPSFFSLADRSSLRRSLREAGFKDVHTEDVTVTYELSTNDFVQRACDVNVILKNALAERPDSGISVRERIAEAAQQFAVGHGLLRIPNQSICVAGQK